MQIPRAVPVLQIPRAVPVPPNLSARNTWSLVVILLSEVGPSFLMYPIPNILSTFAKPSYYSICSKTYLEKEGSYTSMGMATYLSTGESNTVIYSHSCLVYTKAMVEARMTNRRSCFLFFLLPPLVSVVILIKFVLGLRGCSVGITTVGGVEPLPPHRHRSATNQGINSNNSLLNRAREFLC